MSTRDRLRILAGYTVLSALIALVVLLIVARRPAGRPVQLQPVPTMLPLRVHVTGAVAVPGVYALPPGSVVDDAVRVAGGAAAEADLDRLNLARLLKDGDQVLVPAAGATPPARVESAAGGGAEPAAGGAEPAAPAASTGPINVNTATQEELEALPGIGPALAARIVEHRNQHGPFASVEALVDVSGIGPAKLDVIRDLVRVE
jgi:competence protein ComEA